MTDKRIAAADAVDLPPPLRFNETTGELEPLSWQQEKQELIEVIGGLIASIDKAGGAVERTASEIRARAVLAKHGGKHG